MLYRFCFIRTKTEVYNRQVVVLQEVNALSQGIIQDWQPSRNPVIFLQIIERYGVLISEL